MAVAVVVGRFVVLDVSLSFPANDVVLVLHVKRLSRVILHLLSYLRLCICLTFSSVIIPTL